MLRVLGRASSINVRKVLWSCAEIGLPHRREDWGTGFRPTSDPAFAALNPHRLVPAVVAPGDATRPDFAPWESGVLDAWLGHDGPWAARDTLTLADVVLGLSVQHWRRTPIEHSALPAVQAYFDRVASRPACAAAGCADHP